MENASKNAICAIIFVVLVAGSFLIGKFLTNQRIKSSVKALHQSIDRYEEDHKKLPSTLTDLEKEGYLDDKLLEFIKSPELKYEVEENNVTGRSREASWSLRYSSFQSTCQKFISGLP